MGQVQIAPGGQNSGQQASRMGSHTGDPGGAGGTYRPGPGRRGQGGLRGRWAACPVKGCVCGGLLEDPQGMSHHKGGVFITCVCVLVWGPVLEAPRA